MRRCLPAWMLGLGLCTATATLSWNPARAADGGVESAADEARRNQIVAKGAGFSITLGMMEDQINKQPPAMRARFRTLEERKALLTSMVRLELLAAEAARRGLDQSSAVQQTIKDGSVQSLLRVQIDEKISADNVSKEDIAAYYAANPGDFHHPAQRRASHIALGSEAEAKALLAEAKQADLHAFADLARKRSQDGETKLRGGDLGFFPLSPGREEWTRKVPEALRKAAFALAAVGDTATAPVVIGTQFSIVRLTGERPERHVDLTEAESTIRSRLWRERRRKAVDGLIDSLRGRDKPKVHVERVDWVKFDDMDKRPPGFSPDPVPGRRGPVQRVQPSAPTQGKEGALPKGAVAP